MALLVIYLFILVALVSHVVGRPVSLKLAQKSIMAPFKKFNHLLVIAHFFEEDRLLILKLKDCLPNDTLNFMNENYNIEEWNREKVMHVARKGMCYPARFLQFGDDSEKMTNIINRLIKKEITVDKVPILQCNNVMTNGEIKKEIIHDDQKSSAHLSLLSSSSIETNDTAARKLNLENISPSVKEESEENDKRKRKVTAIDDPVEKMAEIIEISDDLNVNHQRRQKSRSSSESTSSEDESANSRNSEAISVATTEGMEEGDREEVMIVSNDSSVEKMPLTKRTSNYMDENQQLARPIAKKQRISEILSDLTAESNAAAGCDYCKVMNDNCKFLKKQCRSLEKENFDLNGENAILKAKLKVQKEKYKNLKGQMKGHKRASIAVAESNLIKIGDSTFVNKNKLSLCRTKTPSVFTGDLLDVVFGKEILSKSCVKGYYGTSKKPLPADTVKDILSFVSSKFSIEVGYVKAAIRQKLNTCHKSSS